MRKVNNWLEFLLGVIVYIYGLGLMLVIVVGMFGILSSNISFFTFITSLNTMQTVLISILLMISGDYLVKNSSDEEEVVLLNKNEMELK